MLFVLHDSFVGFGQRKAEKAQWSLLPVDGVRERREGWRVQAQDLGSGSKHSLDLL